MNEMSAFLTVCPSLCLAHTFEHQCNEQKLNSYLLLSPLPAQIDDNELQFQVEWKMMLNLFLEKD